MKKKNYTMWQDEEEMDVMDEEDMEIMPMNQKMMMTEGEIPMVLAHSYVPWQYYDTAFCPQEALMKGTLFPELWGVYPIPQ